MTKASASKPLDRRQRKSREAIQNALLALLRDKPLDEITISELAVKADVNRKTFYNNYHNIQEVRDELDDRYLDMVFSLIESSEPGSSRTRLDDFFLKMFHGMRENLEQCRLLFDSGEHLCLTSRLKESIHPYLEKELSSSMPESVYLPYIQEYISSGLSSLINLWLHSSPLLPDADIAQLASDLIRSTLSEFRKAW
jgi:AcrR family transcriptional regulator